jgi:hypothetical protein
MAVGIGVVMAQHPQRTDVGAVDGYGARAVGPGAKTPDEFEARVPAGGP